MALTGQAKTDYQREYMRKRSKKRRINSGSKVEGLTQHPRVSDQDFTRLMAGAGPGHVRVSKPGDADYEPQCETTKAFVEGRPKAKSIAKEVKCFEDLPPDVQQTINRMSMVDGKIDQTIKANRTGIAVHYQHLFPDKYNSTGAG